MALLLLSQGLWAQSPGKMSYQGVIRDSGNALISNQSVGMQISILQGSISGTAVYVETQSPTTNVNGLVSIEIGTGTVVSGAFNAIDWSNGPFFIKTETDPIGGASYSISGTSELLSVPYALHSTTADQVLNDAVDDADADPTNELQTWSSLPGVPSTLLDGDDIDDADADPTNEIELPTTGNVGDMVYWNGTAWVSIPSGTVGQVLTIGAGGQLVWSYNAAPVPNVTNPSTGEVWMDRNLGATRVATSSTDASAYGDLYQWGRAADGHESRTSATTGTLSTSDTPGHGDFILAPSTPNDWRSPQNDNLWQGVSGINNPCPSTYRLPTNAEWQAERTSWTSNNAAGAYNSPLRLPVAGLRSSSNGALIDVGSYGYYWSSAIDGPGSRYLLFGSSVASLFSYFRAFGFSVRCLKD